MCATPFWRSSHMNVRQISTTTVIEADCRDCPTNQPKAEALKGPTKATKAEQMKGVTVETIHAIHPPFSIGHTLIPILRALSTRLALMPLPGQAITALGNASSI